MNERIRQLAEQANWLFADKVTGEFTDYDKRIQKFAELIVKECAIAFEAEVDSWFRVTVKTQRKRYV
jgi:hypothetical protein